MQTKVVLHTSGDTSELFKKLCGALESKNASAKVKETGGGVECVFNETEERNARRAISETARGYIVDNFEEREIVRIIAEGYTFFNGDEKRRLTESIRNSIHNEEDIHDKLFVLRRNRIIETVIDNYFDEKRVLNLDGFLPFRLQDYSKELEDLIDYSADNFLMRKEYDEFIELLKAYVSVQPHEIDVLNIVVTENREYIYYDSREKPLKGEFEMEAAEEFGAGYESEDLLVSILITKNPRKIIIHNRQFMKHEIAQTVEKIFEGRVGKCDGCKLCRVLQ
ncbi:MAG: putative sporulation protein YtxC [Bacillota bacterium]|nr:putative sporulation protein YtxC [Bacillota bacterium]